MAPVFGPYPRPAPLNDFAESTAGASTPSPPLLFLISANGTSPDPSPGLIPTASTSETLTPPNYSSGGVTKHLLKAAVIAPFLLLLALLPNAWPKAARFPRIFIAVEGYVFVDMGDRKPDSAKMVGLPQTPSRQGEMPVAFAPETPPSPSLGRPLLHLASARSQDIFLATLPIWQQRTGGTFITPIARKISATQDALV